MSEFAAFSGIRVLDLSQGIAGPHCAMLLAQHGADVIKVEPIEGDWGRNLGRPFGEHTAHSIAFNRGKRSIALDLRSDDGLGVCRRLAERCDVFIEAFRPGVMAKFSLAYEDVKVTNPNVVYLSVNGFGSVGPDCMLPVTDAVIQAFSGLMTVNRCSAGLPNRLAMTPVDVVTGLYGFQAASTALMRRFRFGEGGYVEVSLMQAAAAFQAAKIMEFDLEKGEPEPLYSPVGTMRTSDGFINITAMRDQHFVALCAAIGRPELATDPLYQGREMRIRNERTLLPILREEFVKHPTSYWSRELTAAGVMNAAVQNYGEFLEHPQTQATKAVSYTEHPGVGRIAIARIPGCQPADAGPELRAQAPRIGQHTIDVLTELGYSSTEIDELLSNGGVRQMTI